MSWALILQQTIICDEWRGVTKSEFDDIMGSSLLLFCLINQSNTKYERADVYPAANSSTTVYKKRTSYTL